jgi:hypothetical protein
MSAGEILFGLAAFCLLCSGLWKITTGLWLPLPWGKVPMRHKQHTYVVSGLASMASRKWDEEYVGTCACGAILERCASTWRYMDAHYSDVEFESLALRRP